MVDENNPENMKEFDTNENMVNDTPNEDAIVDKVVEKLKPEINKKLQSIQSRISNDIEIKMAEVKSDIIISMKEIIENMEKSKVPTPNVNQPNMGQPNVDIAKIMKMLSGKDGESFDMSKVAALMNQVQTPPMTNNNGKPIDMADMTPGQVEYMKMQNQQQMITTILPMLLQSQSGDGDSMLGKMANNMLMKNLQSANISSDLYNKHLNKMMFKENMKTDSNEKQTKKTNDRKNNGRFVNR